MYFAPQESTVWRTKSVPGPDRPDRRAFGTSKPHSALITQAPRRKTGKTRGLTTICRQESCARVLPRPTAAADRLVAYTVCLQWICVSVPFLDFYFRRQGYFSGDLENKTKVGELWKIKKTKNGILLLCVRYMCPYCARIFEIGASYINEQYQKLHF